LPINTFPTLWKMDRVFRSPLAKSKKAPGSPWTDAKIKSLRKERSPLPGRSNTEGVLSPTIGENHVRSIRVPWHNPGPVVQGAPASARGSASTHTTSTSQVTPLSATRTVSWQESFHTRMSIAATRIEELSAALQANNRQEMVNSWCEKLKIDEQRQKLRDYAATPHGLTIFTVVAFSILLLLFVVPLLIHLVQGGNPGGTNAGSALSAGGLRRGPKLTGQAVNFWLMCRSFGHCGEADLQGWHTSPKFLAKHVAIDLASLPGLPQSAYGPVYAHWKQSPPQFRGAIVRLEDLAMFMSQLLASDPFGTGDMVPWIDFGGNGEGKVAVVTQRQLAFLVANVLMGNSISHEKGDGLSAALKRCSAKNPVPSSFVFSLLSFLAVLSQELTPHQQGASLVAATPKALDKTAWKSVWKNSSLPSLAAPTLCVDGFGAKHCGLADFMAGGTPFQAMTDIAGAFVGGGAELCQVANSQDESAVQFYSEALAFAFFVGGNSMLPVPWTLLGARRYLRDFGGESGVGPPFFASCGKIRGADWLNEDIHSFTVNATLYNRELTLHAGAFVAVASVCSGCVAGDTCSHKDLLNHNCNAQRQHLDEDVARWLQAYDPNMYNPVVEEAFRSTIRRIGTGPWGAGVWWGDSQLYFMTVWLATNLLSGGAAALDYYVYDHFCENPSNQCFVLGDRGCSECVAKGQPGAGVDASRCGHASLLDMVNRFAGKHPLALYEALLAVGAPPTQVFDLLLQETSGGDSMIVLK